MSFSGIVFVLVGSIFSLFCDAPRPSAPAQAIEKKSCKAIVFDLGGVVVDTCKKKIFWQIGPKVFFDYWRNAKSSHDLHTMQKRLYALLNAAHPSHKEGNQWGVNDGHGKELPQLLAEWLRGMKPNKELYDQVVAFADKNPTWFTHPSERSMLIKTSRTIFNPRAFIRTRKFFDESIELIHECKARGFKLYILSNWDRESGKLMVEKKPDLFTLFDGIIFSGDVQSIKPEPAIFENITDIIPAEECVFIDDQPENTQIAQALGFNTILVENNGGKPNIKAVREQLNYITPSLEETIYV